MLNEPASSVNDRPVVRAPGLHVDGYDDKELNELRDMIATVLLVDDELVADPDVLEHEDGMMLMAQGNRLIASFEGRLLLDSEEAYERLDELLAPLNRLALFREVGGKHLIHVLTGRANPQPRAWWPNLLLFVITIFSVLLVGTELAISQVAMENEAQAIAMFNNFFGELWRGWPYAVSILLILGAHELGHYFAARRHKLAVTLPYFIPLPFLSMFGTLGAFIQLRQPIRNRKILMDVGAAGPLSGLVFAVIILFIGLANTPPTPLSEFGEGGVYEGDSIVYAMAKTFTYGRFLPDGEYDVCFNCNQLTYAGWTGLLVTALNLFPVGQLDGGHILYAAIGDRARRLYLPLIAMLVFLTLFVSTTWWLWLMMLIFLGRVYATPLDNITQLDRPRRLIAAISIVVFIAVFVPAPMTPPGGGGFLNGGALALIAPSAIFNIVNRLRARFSGRSR